MEAFGQFHVLGSHFEVETAEGSEDDLSAARFIKSGCRIVFLVLKIFRLSPCDRFVGSCANEHNDVVLVPNVCKFGG